MTARPARPEGFRRPRVEELLLLPMLAVLAIVFVYPLVQVVRLSFDRDTFRGSSFVGLDNYRYILFDDPNFWTAVFNNLFLLLGIPVMVVLALVVAFLIFDGVRSPKLSGFYRSLVFLPFVLSIVVVGRVFSVFLRSDGPVNGLANSLGWGVEIAWLGDSTWAVPSVLGVIVWREFGLGVILFLARLTTVPDELFEAARVEGASWWQTLRNVAIPQLAPTIAFWVLFNVIIMFSWVFTYVFVLTNGGPGTASTVLELEIYRWATTRDQTNIAAAVATMLLVLVVGLIVGQTMLRRHLVRPIE